MAVAKEMLLMAGSNMVSGWVVDMFFEK